MSIKNDLHHQRTKLTKNLSSAVLTLIAMNISTVSVASDVKMYNHVPSANEMANVLFPKASEQSLAPKRVKMRSISFDPVKKSTPQVEAKADLEANAEQLTKSVGIGLPIQFDFNSDSITSASRPYIDELGKMLSREDLLNENVIIEGHTDAVGSALYNKQLSMRRAQSIKQYLFSQYGIDRHRMMVSGKGEYAPLKGQNPFAAVNRRVEIHKSQ
jgi:outer membrane protein OmpA-like peptidoglycan-associated protein